LSPDGKQIAFVASTTQPVNSYTQPDLWVVDLTPDAKPRNLTAALDSDIGRGLTGDNAPPRAGGPTAPIWTADGRGVMDLFSKEGRNNLVRFDAATGAMTEITRGNQGVLRFRASADRSKIVYTLSTPTMVNELFVLDASGGQAKQLTKINDGLFSQLNLTSRKRSGTRASMGNASTPGCRSRRALIRRRSIRSSSISTAARMPLTATSSCTSSSGWRRKATSCSTRTRAGARPTAGVRQHHQHNYPGDDYKDLMAGVDEVVKRGYVDTAKLGVTGGSGGGLLTNWTITQTDRFAAAVSQRDIADWEAWWYTADFTLFQPTWFKGAPFNEQEDFRSRSPITHINNVKTPLMLILGEADYRTPPSSGGDQMFRALKYRKIPTVMVRFPGESHELSRSGKPWHRIERLQHIVGWFDKWLMGVAKPEYEIAPEADGR
jgi:dipeptidyl aminopeptidase/acylaminoacyl peptidase